MNQHRSQLTSLLSMQKSKPKVLDASPSNFARIIDSNDLQYNERPMMLTVWTQTTSEDFNYLSDDRIKRDQQQYQTERELREKIRDLEEKLRTQSQLLSQIHATSATYNSLQHEQHYTAQPQQQQQNNTALINAVQQVPQEASIKYRIITESNSVANGDPIEIQLDDSDTSINLNCSADSNRLEISIPMDDDCEDLNRDKNETSNAPSVAEVSSQSLRSASSPQSLSKRRKIFVESPQNTSRTYDSTGTVNAMYADIVSSSVLQQYKLNSICSSSKGSGNGGLMPSSKKRDKSPTENDAPVSLHTPKIVMDNVMVSIGPNNTRIPARVYEGISWTTHSIATRKLLMAIFDRNTLATHSMTGKPSPAFRGHGKPLKEMLDPLITQDIVFAVSRKCNVSEKEVRNAITTKLADENKMMKLKMRKGSYCETNKENRNSTN